jgi:hypothetical protein
VDKQGAKIKNFESHGKRKGVEYNHVLFVASWFIFAGSLDFFPASSRER